MSEKKGYFDKDGFVLSATGVDDVLDNDENSSSIEFQDGRKDVPRFIIEMLNGTHTSPEFISTVKNITYSQFCEVLFEGVFESALKSHIKSTLEKGNV